MRPTNWKSWQSKALAVLQTCNHLWFRALVEESGINLLDTDFCSEVAWFHLNEYENSQSDLVQLKSTFFSTKCPCVLISFGVWCALSRLRMVVPSEETGYGNVFRDAIITQFISILKVDERECWVQQDGATFHTSDETVTFLRQFSAIVLSTKACGPRDLRTWRPSISFSGATLKEWSTGQTYTHWRNIRPISKLQLQTAVATLRKVSANMVRRARACVHEYGAHIQHLFKVGGVAFIVMQVVKKFLLYCHLDRATIKSTCITPSHIKYAILSYPKHNCVHYDCF